MLTLKAPKNDVFCQISKFPLKKALILFYFDLARNLQKIFAIGKIHREVVKGFRA